MEAFDAGIGKRQEEFDKGLLSSEELDHSLFVGAKRVHANLVSMHTNERLRVWSKSSFFSIRREKICM